MALRPSAYRDGTVGVTGNRDTPPDAVPSIVVAGEQYNMLARLAAEGQPVSLRVELRTRYLEDDRNSYNVIAEIPGRDPALRDRGRAGWRAPRLVAHRERRHRQRRRRGRRDGGDAHPPRARRPAAAHDPRGAVERRGAGAARRARLRRAALQHAGGTGSARRLSERRSRAAARRSASTWKGISEAKAIFDRWLEPLKDLGATRNIIEGIGATDHVPFNEAGLPGFNVIKDFDAYDERTRHTNADYPRAHERGRAEAVRHRHGDVRVAGGDGRREDPEDAGQIASPLQPSSHTYRSNRTDLSVKVDAVLFILRAHGLQNVGIG